MMAGSSTIASEVVEMRRWRGRGAAGASACNRSTSGTGCHGAEEAVLAWEAVSAMSSCLLIVCRHMQVEARLKNARHDLHSACRYRIAIAKAGTATDPHIPAARGTSANLPTVHARSVVL